MYILRLEKETMKDHLELAKHEHSLLAKFIRMIDYMLLETFSISSINEMGRLVMEIEKGERKTGGLFSCNVVFGEIMMFNPDQIDVITSVE